MASIRAFIMGGNTFAKVGGAVLLIGVGLLGQQAAVLGYFPPEARLALGAVMGLGLLALGWKLRIKRPGFAMIIQGVGIGALYLATFVGMRVFDLIPAPLAFGIFVALALFTAVLAVLQDSLPLAVFGSIGGFIAPILASTGSGSHVALFSYYLLLNATIVGIALRRSWRPLNLLGFTFTFGVGTTWGVTSYEPEHFISTEPFLIAFFLMYVVTAWLYARRGGPGAWVDGSLTFGTPLAFLGLQSAMVHDMEFAMAWSCLGLAFFYLALGQYSLRRAPDVMRPMSEALLAIGVGFGTITIPFALDNHRLTGATWAIEGAGLYWLGVRQNRFLSRLAAYGLQIAAVIALIYASGNADYESTPNPFINTQALSLFLVAIGGYVIAYFSGRYKDCLKSFEKTAATGFLLWATFFALMAGASETGSSIANFMLYALALAMALEFVGHRLNWPKAQILATTFLPAASLVLLVMLGEEQHLFYGNGVAAWLVYLPAAYWLLRRGGKQMPKLGRQWLHGLTSLVVVAAVCVESVWWLRRWVDGETIWDFAVTLGTWDGALLVFILSGSGYALSRLSPRDRFPFSDASFGYLLCGLTLAACGLLVAANNNISLAADPKPLPFIPLINPVDLSHLFALLIMAKIVRSAAFDNKPFSELRRPVVVVLLALSFAWLNGIILRTLHHFAGIRFNFDAMWHSPIAQTTLSIAWSLIALLVMLWAVRRTQRSVWISGGVLLGVVVLKLFVVDLAALETIARIVSFIGVGLLLLAIGYFVPVPPLLESTSATPHSGDDNDTQ